MNGTDQRTTTTNCHQRCCHRHHSTKFTMINLSCHCYFFGSATLSCQPMNAGRRGAFYAFLSNFHSVWILVDLLRASTFGGSLSITNSRNGIMRVEIFSYMKFKSNWTMKPDAYPMEINFDAVQRTTKKIIQICLSFCAASQHIYVGNFK